VADFVRNLRMYKIEVSFHIVIYFKYSVKETFYKFLRNRMPFHTSASHTAGKINKQKLIPALICTNHHAPPPYNIMEIS